MDVPVHMAIPSWFARVTLQRTCARAGAKACSLWTAVDVFIDAGVPEWLITKCAASADLSIQMI